ncbi:MAG: aconitate hydratase [Deltaproteobacteria bacterium]|nr:aconitate hydratase [Deltaproteobacteria bacterium]
MAANMTHDVLSRCLMHGKLRTGEEIGVRADQLLTQDGTGTMVFLQLEKLGTSRLKGRFAICYVDHNTLGEGPENADDHRFLRSACERFRLHFSRPGNGIGHQVHLERFAVPGQLLLGADSHVTTLGGLGMLAIGTGGLELAVAMTGSPHYLICPAVIRVVLGGQLAPWCSAKDAVLHIIERLAQRNCVGVSLEYDGPGVKNLSVAQRATIANMGAELGLTSSLFPADERTRAFLAAQGRARDYRRLAPKKSAGYDDEIQVDLSRVVPMVALPPSPLKAVPVRDVAGLDVQQVAVGSCTNGGFYDIARLAMVVRKRKIHPELSAVVAPASRQVFQALLTKGYLADLSAAGFRLAESVCGFCIGHGHAPASGSVSVRTSNRNFIGRCGTRDARVYLVSPETAAATALTGKLTDPRDLRRPAPRVREPARYPIDDTSILPPTRKRKPVELHRGPNIVDPPVNEPLPASIQAEVVLKVGDGISTDEILPAGRWLKYRSNVQRYARHAFADIAPGFAERALENLEHETFTVIVAGEGYGQGSSREHAAMCVRLLGVRVILAKSFERIHLTNLINHGIVPLRFLDQRTYDRIQQDDYLELPWIARELRKSETVSLRNPDTSVEYKVKHGLTRRQIKILLAGGLGNYISRQQA